MNRKNFKSTGRVFPRTGAFLLCLCAVWAVIPLNATAQDASDQESIASTDHERSEALQAAALEHSLEISRRQQALENLQSEYGVYSPVLTEAYADFGAYYASMGDHASAVAMYGSAFQIARISNGLYSAEQLPPLQQLIASTIQIADWQEVDRLEHLRYHISSRLYLVDDEHFLLAATAYGDWKLRVVRENLLELGSRALVSETETLSAFYDRVITDIETRTDATQEDLLQMIYGKSLADMALARVLAATPYTAFQGTVNQYVSETRCQNVVNSQGQVVRQCFSVQVENPRYRQSQQDAKEMAVGQYAREVNRSIDKLKSITAQSAALSSEQRQELESHIAQLETESTLLLRSSRRRFLFQ